MQVICNHSRGCPIPAEECVHKEPHPNSMRTRLPDGFELLPSPTFCDVSERVCALRYPKERIRVMCQPVERCIASMVSGHPEAAPV